MDKVKFKHVLKIIGIVVACLVAVLEVLNGSVSEFVLDTINAFEGIGAI